MKKYSVLMYNFNDYEIMREPQEVDPDCEYIYVTDNPKFKDKTKVWKVIVDNDLKGLSPFDKCYSVRFNLFKYATTPVCIYMDGSIQVYKPLTKLYNDFMNSGCELGLIVHPLRFSINKEYEIWKACRKYPEEQKQKCLKAMTAMGYDFNYKGLYEMTVRIVKNTERNKMIDQAAFDLLKKLGTKDKIERLYQTVYSFLMNSVFNDTNVFPMSEQIIHSDYMKWCLHKKKTINPMLANTDKRNEGFLFNKLVRLYKIFDTDFKKLPEAKVKRDAIISMTSWKKRINTVSQTIFSLLKNCPGFKIVLTLCTEEFPNKEKDLPSDLVDMAKNNYVEILWVKDNTYTFKKMLPTMKKYPNVPIITADDGVRYNRNYAEELYQLWLKNPNKIISYNTWNKQGVTFGGGGSGIIFPPNCFHGYTMTKLIIQTKHDDYYYGCLAKQAGIQWQTINKKPKDSNFESIDSVYSVSTKFYINEKNLCSIIKNELGMK
jgi:hypothetical protein